MRITLARRVVCRVLSQAEDAHFTADEIFERAAALTAGINPITVLRTLTALEKLGMIQHVHHSHGPGHYFIGGEGQHVHMVCERCGHTIAISPSGLMRSIEGASEEHGFTITGTNLAVLGVCNNCALT